MTEQGRAFVSYLEDILENAENLKAFTAGLSFEDFNADLKTQAGCAGTSV